MASLEVRSLWRTHPGGLVAVRDASFAVPEGRICAVVGPADCGKTTLLRLIAGLDRADDGDVLLDDLSIAGLPPHRRGIGMMFQDLALFPHLSVNENVAFGLRMVGWPRAEREQRVSDLLEVVGLAARGRDAIGALSAGEQQRVALARTLAPQPSALLLDEPLGIIDEAAKVALRLDLRSVLNALETTTVIASDDLRDVIALADDVVVMSAGRVLQAGSMASVLGDPASVEVADLAGYVTLAHGAVRRGRVEEAGVGAMAVPGLVDEEAVRVMAHPSTLLAVPADSGLGSGVAGLVVRSRAQGPTWLVDLAVGTRVIEARWEWDLVPPRTGTRLAIAARPGTLRVFGASLVDLPAPVMPAAPAASTPPAPAPSRSAAPVESRAGGTTPPLTTPPQAPAGAAPTPPAMRPPGRPAPTPGAPERRHDQMPLS